MDDHAFRDERRRELVADHVNGASPLARQALDTLSEYAGICDAADVATLRSHLLGFAEELQYARPNMAPVFNLVQRWVDRIDRFDATDIADLRQEAANAAAALASASLDAVDQAARNAADHIGRNVVVMTHSLSSTIQACFTQLAPWNVRAIVTESRPGLEGRNQARQLDQLGIPVTFITDAQIGPFIREADVALIGADTVLADGAVINKSGSYLLALAARDAGIPFYVCCESFKHVPFGVESYELDEMDPREINAPTGRHITARNIYFDLTPARLIESWITENGVRPRNKANR